MRYGNGIFCKEHLMDQFFLIYYRLRSIDFEDIPTTHPNCYLITENLKKNYIIYYIYIYYIYQSKIKSTQSYHKNIWHNGVLATGFHVSQVVDWEILGTHQVELSVCRSTDKVEPKYFDLRPKLSFLKFSIIFPKF